MRAPRLASPCGIRRTRQPCRARGLAHSKVKIRNFESEADLSPPPAAFARPVPLATAMPRKSVPMRMGAKLLPSSSYPNLPHSSCPGHTRPKFLSPTASLSNLR